MMVQQIARKNDFSGGAKSLFSLGDLSESEILDIVRTTAVFKQGKYNYNHLLADKSIGIYFKKTSTRTRTSFTLAAKLLGAVTISFYPDDLQLNTGESLHDTGMVLSEFLDILVIRSAEDWKDMKVLSANNTLSIVNAMSSQEHPTQALADMYTLYEHFDRLEEIDFLYLGEGNNTASALCAGLVHMKNSHITFATPDDYSMPIEVIKDAQKTAEKNGTTLEVITNPSSINRQYDVIYTTRWQTTGTVKPDHLWLEKFRAFTVSKKTFNSFKRDTKSVFMHDLPAVRGEEVASSVIDGEHSIVLQQAQNKLFSAMAVLSSLFSIQPR